MIDTIIATPVLSDAGSITASTATIAAPVTNLQRIQPTDTWRSTGLISYLIIDLLTAKPFNLISLLFTNASAGCTWRIRTSDASANLSTTPDYDSGIVSFATLSESNSRPHGFMFRAAGWNDRFIRIDIDDSANVIDSFNSVGRLYISNGYASEWPRSSVSYGFNDLSLRDRTARGNTIITQQGLIPTASFELNVPTEAEFYGNTYKIQALRAASKDVLVIFDKDSATVQDKIYYGLLNPTMRTTNSEFRQYIQKYEIEGLI